MFPAALEAGQSPVVPVRAGGPQQRVQGKGLPQQSLAAAENTLVQPDRASTLATEVTWGWMRADKGKLTLDFPARRQLVICWSWGTGSIARSLASFGEELAWWWHLGTMLPVPLVTFQHGMLPVGSPWT